MKEEGGRRRYIEFVYSKFAGSVHELKMKLAPSAIMEVLSCERW